MLVTASPPVRVTAVVALLALLHGAAIPIFDGDLAAWRYDHGHISLAGFVSDHQHPWNERHAQAEAEERGLVFTFAGASVTPDGGAEVPRANEMAPAVGSLERATSSRTLQPIEAPADRLTPPPRA